MICPDFPIGVGIQNFDSWKKCLDKNKKFINSDTIFIGRSIAPIFIVKYCILNDIKIKSLYSVSGFNNAFIDNGEYDEVNKTFYLEDISKFKGLCENRICIISENDPYVKLNYLTEFAKNIDAKVLNIKNGGHFNTESGYTKFVKLLSLIKKYENL